MRRRFARLSLYLAVAAFLALLALGLWDRFREDASEGWDDAHVANAVDSPSEAPTLQGQAEVPASEGAPVDASGTDRRWGVTGRVLGCGRRPAPGARVAVWLGTERRAEAVTDRDGRFRVAPSSPPGELPIGVFVRAEDTDGRVGMKNRTVTSTRDGDYDIGTLVLRRGHELTVLVETANGPLASARVDLGGGGQVRQGFAGPARTDDSGIARFPGLPPEEFTIVAWAEGYGPSSAIAGLPRLETEPVRIFLQPPRTLEVEVVEGADSRPVEGVEVVIRRRWVSLRRSSMAAYHPPLRVEPTDARGRTRIEGVGRDPTLCVGVGARGFAVRRYVHRTGSWRTSFRKYVPVPPNEEFLRIEVPGGRRVEWPVVAGDAPVPPDGAAIAFCETRGARRIPGVDGGRMENGHLVVEGLLASPFRATVVAPDGALAVVAVGPVGDEGPEISFSRPRAIDVSVRRSDGTPAAEIRISVHEDPDRPPLADAVRTDARGRAHVAGLPPVPVQVVAGPPRWQSEILELSRGDARLEITLGEETVRTEHPVRIRVRVNGAPALPDEYRLGTTSFEESGVRVLSEDPEAGVLEAVWTPAPGREGVVLGLSAPGFTVARAEVSVGVEEIDLALEPAGSLLFRVHHDLGRKRPGTWDSGLLERSLDGGRTWQRVDGTRRYWRTSEAPEHGRAWWIDLLEPGLYRGRGSRSNRTSDPVRVSPGADPVVLTLDLRALDAIEGRVVVPPGTDVGAGYVEVSDEGGDGRVRELAVDEQGQFRLPWEPPVGAWVVTVRHPWLRPHSERGSMRLEGAVERLRLELVSGGIAEVRLEVEHVGGRVPRPPRAPRVLLLASRGAREPLIRTPASIEVLEDGTWRLSFSGYDAGTYVVWADLSSRHAPLVLGPVELDELDPDLGVVPLAVGSRVRAVFSNSVRGVPAILILQADAMDGPPHTRTTVLESASEATVSGLGPGRYRLRGGPVRLSAEEEVPADLDEILEADGRSAYERVVRLDAGGD